jgi:hypothetical protein
MNAFGMRAKRLAPSKLVQVQHSSNRNTRDFFHSLLACYLISFQPTPSAIPFRSLESANRALSKPYTMNSKVKYSDLPLDGSSYTLSVDSDPARLEKTAFLDDEIEPPLLRRSWGSIVTVGLPWLLVAGLSIALLRSYLSSKRACAEDDLENTVRYPSKYNSTVALILMLRNDNTGSRGH